MNIKLISHRGNFAGKTQWENDPSVIDCRLKEGYDVEIDLRTCNNTLWLGHDKPQYQIAFTWLLDRREKLWIHCKTVETLLFMRHQDQLLMMNGHQPFHYFYHEKDDVVLTSKGFLWHYPGVGSLCMHSIGCLPELHGSWNLNICYGVCSDYIERYK